MNFMLFIQIHAYQFEEPSKCFYSSCWFIVWNNSEEILNPSESSEKRLFLCKLIVCNEMFRVRSPMPEKFVYY